MKGRVKAGILLAAGFGFAALAGCSTNTKDVGEAADGAAQNSQPAQQPAEGGAAPAGQDGARITAAALKLRVPEGWIIEVPSSSMRAAQFRVPSGGGGVNDGEITVFHFGPGGGGGVQDNLVRWANQFPQEDGADPMSRAKIETKEVGGFRVSTIDLTGRFQTGGMGGPDVDEPGYRLLGAIIEGKGGPWFIKGAGPEAVMDANKEKFEGLIATASL
jgi:hypothetical protein